MEAKSPKALVSLGLKKEYIRQYRSTQRKPFLLLDSRFRGNDGSYGFPLPRLRGHRFRGNDVLKIDIYLPISNLISITFIRLGTQKRDESEFLKHQSVMENGVNNLNRSEVIPQNLFGSEAIPQNLFQFFVA